MAKELKINRTGIVVICALGLVVTFFLLYQARGGNYVEPTIRVSELISASIHLVEQAGKVVVTVRKSGDEDIKALLKGQTKEGKGEYVTLGDKVCLHASLCLHELLCSTRGCGNINDTATCSFQP